MSYNILDVLSITFSMTAHEITYVQVSTQRNNCSTIHHQQIKPLFSVSAPHSK